MQDMACDLT